jgi:hypothetical protein
MKQPCWKRAEKVTGYGLIDDGLNESRKIEASTVYVHVRNACFYANAAMTKVICRGCS